MKSPWIQGGRSVQWLGPYTAPRWAPRNVEEIHVMVTWGLEVCGREPRAASSDQDLEKAERTLS